MGCDQFNSATLVCLLDELHPWLSIWLVLNARDCMRKTMIQLKAHTFPVAGISSVKIAQSYLEFGAEVSLWFCTPQMRFFDFIDGFRLTRKRSVMAQFFPCLSDSSIHSCISLSLMMKRIFSDTDDNLYRCVWEVYQLQTLEMTSLPTRDQHRYRIGLISIIIQESQTRSNHVGESRNTALHLQF